MSQNVNSAGSTTEKKIGYSSENELIKELKECLSTHPTIKETAANYLYHSLVDDMILGLVLKFHHDRRLGLIDDEQTPENCAPYSGENSSIPNNFDKNVPTRKTAVCQCICPICNKGVEATGFVTHLQNCMGIIAKDIKPTRQASRLASRRLEGSRGGTTYASDDDDDVAEKRKRRNNSTVRSNGKRNGKTS